MWQTRALASAPVVQFVPFWQGLHGQVSRKPTTIMSCRLPSLKKHLSYKHKTQFPDPTRDVSCRFATTQLKEYPPSMSAAIAAAIGDTVSASMKVRSRSDNSESETFLVSELRTYFDAYVIPLTDEHIASRVGTDYHPQAVGSLFS